MKGRRLNVGKARALLGICATVVGVLTVGMPLSVRAQTADSGFALQVTPSPLVATIEPGKKSTLELRINNTGTTVESYKMDLRSFKVDSNTGSVDLQNDQPQDIASFVSFEQPTFVLEPGQWINQRILVDTPEDAGFSYSFAIMVQREEKAQQSKGATIQGSVAVFTLLNVSRADAVKQLDVVEFNSAKKVYEYLPTTFSLKIKNSGNTIVAPKGNIFISRKGSDTAHTGLLQINESGGYIVPESTRLIAAKWDDGYPAYVTTAGVTKADWDISRLSKLRIGKYTAKAIVIYDDGTRDIPIETEVSFWVIPWKILLGVATVVGLLLTGVVSVLKKSAKLVKRTPKHIE